MHRPPPGMIPAVHRIKLIDPKTLAGIKKKAKQDLEASHLAIRAYGGDRTFLYMLTLINEVSAWRAGILERCAKKVEVKKGVYQDAIEIKIKKEYAAPKSQTKKVMESPKS